MKKTIITLRVLSSLVLLALAGSGAAGQEIPGTADLAQQSLRPYWHVFAAYAIVIVAVGGWAVSIARRLRSVEDRLTD